MEDEDHDFGLKRGNLDPNFILFLSLPLSFSISRNGNPKIKQKVRRKKRRNSLAKIARIGTVAAMRKMGRRKGG